MSKKQKKEKTVRNTPDSPKKKESTWEFTRSMIFLIGLVILIKVFVCDIFFIPSGSMEQTLHGHPENGDRIFCTKLNYLWRNPERWEIFVFKFPYQQTPQGENSPYKGEHFIKRCVGLPGEGLALIGGDVFILPPEAKSDTEARRAVKPDSIQQKIWMPVYSEDFSDISPEELKYYWNFSSVPESQLQIKNGILDISTATEPLTLSFRPHTRFGTLSGIPDRYVRRQVVEFACPVIGCDGRVRKTVTSPKMTSRCPRCGEYLQESDVISYDYRTGYPANYQPSFEKVSKVADPQYRGEWWHFVPDLSVTAHIRFGSDTASYRCRILVDDTTYSAEFSPQHVLVSKDGQILKELPATIKPGENTRIQFYHLDGQLRAYIAGKELFNITVDPSELDSTLVDPDKTGVTLEFSGKLQLSNISLQRDIYYYNYRDSRKFFRLPEDGYMALGDNCPSSNDSRFWGPVPQKNLVGTAQFVWWPLHSVRMLH